MSGIPLTRANYLAAAYDVAPGNRPEEWTAEHELSLPEPFQRLDPVEDPPELYGRATEPAPEPAPPPRPAASLLS